MSEKLSIDLSDIRKIIESDWNDLVIKRSVGKYILRKAAEQDKDIAALLETKFVEDVKIHGNPDLRDSILRGCCRGRQ